MPRNSPKFSVSFEWILLVPFEFILWVPFEFSVSFELILKVSFEFSVSFELVLGIQGPVSEPKHIYCQNRLVACQAAYWKIFHYLFLAATCTGIHSGTCYKLVTSPRIAVDAHANCNNNGMNLVVITSEEEQNFIKGMLT